MKPISMRIPTQSYGVSSSAPLRFGKWEDDDEFSLRDAKPPKKDVLGLKARGKGLLITGVGLVGLGATGGLLAAVHLNLLPIIATGVTIYGIRKMIKGK